MIGRLHHVIIDCPDPAALAAFYSELLGLPITWAEPGFAVVSADDTSSGIGFQLAPGLQRPRWPDPSRPQQLHFDVMVDDVGAAEQRVLALGARRLPASGAAASGAAASGDAASGDAASGDAASGAAGSGEAGSGEAGSGGSRVFEDPAGHPFCLIPRPAWAPPVSGSPAGA